MHWLAWKPIFAAGILLGGGWVGYHHYGRHDHWNRQHWGWEGGHDVRFEHRR